MMEQKILAIDLGASSGRVVLGSFDGTRLRIRELQRFDGYAVTLNGHDYWNVLQLCAEIKQGLVCAAKEGSFSSVGIDTWGVDFALLDANDLLLQNPFQYRDSRTQQILPEAAARIPTDELYQITGNQIMEINTAFQLLSEQLLRPELLCLADTLLLMPDFLNFVLTGEKKTEMSIASTTQLLDCHTGQWSPKILDAFDIPQKLFTELIPSGTKVGTLTPAICEELNLQPMDVIAVCGHDTQCAVAATPTTEEDFIFISCGTWSLFGTECAEPLVNELSRQYNLTNERGYGGKNCFLKNITGLWLIQETRRFLSSRGETYTYAQLEQFALAEKPFAHFIDPDAPQFVAHGDIPSRIRTYCQETGQAVPQSTGAIVRCIYESLAMKFLQTLSEVKACTGKTYPIIHILGGGAKDGLLCQMTANACNTTVVAGPVEATVFGNLAIQLLASGAISSLQDARRMIAASNTMPRFYPQETASWTDAYQKYIQIITTKGM